jgi:hypothetical protein
MTPAIIWSPVGGSGLPEQQLTVQLHTPNIFIHFPTLLHQLLPVAQNPVLTDVPYTASPVCLTLGLKKVGLYITEPYPHFCWQLLRSQMMDSKGAAVLRGSAALRAALGGPVPSGGIDAAQLAAAEDQSLLASSGQLSLQL